MAPLSCIHAHDTVTHGRPPANPLATGRRGTVQMYALNGYVSMTDGDAQSRSSTAR